MFLLFTILFYQLYKSKKEEKCYVVNKEEEEALFINGRQKSRKVTVITENNVTLNLYVLNEDVFAKIDIRKWGVVIYRGIRLINFKEL